MTIAMNTIAGITLALIVTTLIAATLTHPKTSSKQPLANVALVAGITVSVLLFTSGLFLLLHGSLSPDASKIGNYITPDGISTQITGWIMLATGSFLGWYTGIKNPQLQH